jgi:DNA repair photolyase
VGGVDWVKEVRLEAGREVAIAALGVEVQVSGRSTMLYRDISHLRESLSTAKIDAGVIVVPDDDLAFYLTDRAPSLREALETIKDVQATRVPIRLLPIGLDGYASTAIEKQRTNLGRLGPVST